MQLKNAFYEITIDDRNGNITSYKNKNGTNYISQYGQEPLFKIRLLNDLGAKLDIRSDFFETVSVKNNDGLISFEYSRLGGHKLSATVTVLYDETEFVRWNLCLDNQTGYAVEWENFPGMLWDHKLPKRKGNHKIFLPILEGVEIEDCAYRTRFFPCFEPDYPSKGWEGRYPGPASMQYMAYYSDTEGFYIAHHDDTMQSKYFDAEEVWNGINVSSKFFPGTEEKTVVMPYQIVTGVYDGSFYGAAEIYRSFIENSALKPKVKATAEWLQNPPLAVVYPIRGEKDTGGLPPTQYYPYTNALPYLSKLKKELGENLLVILMHWEGTAPWCPPYVWPPYGDYKDFTAFIEKLHTDGDLFGLYCSGLGWTEKSIFTDYNKEGTLSEEILRKTMCVAPDNTLPYAFILNGCIRWGYEMCPATDMAKEIMVSEFEKIKQCKPDYVQYFDQNLGGNSSVCYARNHGHPRTPGVWQTKAMRSLVGKITDNTNIVVGCESAAAEGLNDLMPFSDGRNYYGFSIGRPVPGYSYVFHEYVSNFMGNQITMSMFMNVADNPDNLLYRTGYHFAQGDSLCAVLKNDGKINWDWGTSWDEPDPNQKKQLALLKNLLKWRKGNLKNELTRGRMIKPFSVECGQYEIIHKDKVKIAYPSIITSAYKSGENDCQIFVNPFSKKQTVCFKEKKGLVYSSATAEGKPFIGEKLTLPPFGVVKLVLDK